VSWFKSIKDPIIFPVPNRELGEISRQKNTLKEITSADPQQIFSDQRVLGLSISSLSFKITALFCLSLFSLFFIRTGYLQIVQGDYYRSVAEENRFRIEYLPAERGVIVDRNNKTLVENIPAFTLTMTINKLPKETLARENIFNQVIDLVGLQRADIDLLLQEYFDVPDEEIVVKKDLAYEQALLVMSEEKSLSGFAIQFGTKRRYNTTAVSLSHVLGYTGKISSEEFIALKNFGYRRVDEIGKVGVEKSWEQILRGQVGKKLIEVDAAGNQKTVFSEEPPVKGATVKLTIDAELQIVAETALQDEMATINKKKGVVIVTNPQNGEILALVSLPSFNSNLFAGGIDKDSYQNLIEDVNQPLFSRAISGEFPAGSTFKPYVATAALTEGIISSATSFLSTGGVRIGEWFFPDWKFGGHGVTDVRKALAESVNTFFYIIGGGFDTFTGLGVERIVAYAAQFGFGTPTGIDLPSEADGFLPSKEWKEQTKGERWYVGDTYHLAIGQGDLLVTPIQMAASLNTVANGGTKYVPHVVLSVDSQNVSVEEAPLSDQIKKVLPTVREGMRQAVTSGSARRLNTLPIAAAGKTGTAQVAGFEETSAWFTGFAPYNNPEIAVTVLIEQGGEGSSTAVPIAEKIFQWWHENKMLNSDN